MHAAISSISDHDKISISDTSPQVEDAVNVLDDGNETIPATKDLNEKGQV